MKTIINNSNHVITISNKFFSKDVAINEVITVSDNEINNDYFFNFNIFSLKKKVENKVEEVRTIGNRFGLRFSSTSYMPMRTKVDVSTFEEIEITVQPAEFRFLSLIFKTISLVRVIIKNHKTKQDFSFINHSDKVFFLVLVFIELLINLPILVSLIYASFASFIESWGWFECVSLSILTILLTFSNVRRLHHVLYYARK